MRRTAFGFWLALKSINIMAKGDGSVNFWDWQLAEIIDSIWEIGTCSDVANSWAGLVDPLCGGIVGDLQVSKSSFAIA